MCNCQGKTVCPLNNQCLEKCLIYQATVKTSTTTKIYIGCTEGTFKKKYANHVKSFNHKCYSTETELSKYVWKLIDQNTIFKIAWLPTSACCGLSPCAIGKDSPASAVHTATNQR